MEVSSFWFIETFGQMIRGHRFKTIYDYLPSGKQKAIENGHV